MSRTIWLASIIIVVASLNAAPAIAAPNCTSTSPALDEEVTCTYSAGGTTDITVPTGANYMAFVIKGAGGGGGGANSPSAVGAAGGIGAEISATVDISSIDIVRVAIGAGGSGGTGSVMPPFADGGSGGGFSAIHAGASSAATDVLAVAGGGGGGGGTGSGTSTKVGGDGAAANAAAGGDGVSPGYGAPGDGNGGTGGTGADGASWAAGGAGGSGTDINSGHGGAGYGGGEEGDASGAVNGGGGAGGSYVRSALLVGSATYAPTGGAGGTGQAGSSGTDGADGSVTITFSAAPITPPSTTPSTASYIDFSYFLPDGRECTSISPQRVQVGTFVNLPGEDALCRTSEGSLVAGWTIPVPAGFTGAGSSSLPLSPGHRVRVIESQRFTVVPFEPMITVEYDANIAADDACTPANMAFASEDGRMGYSWVPRTDFSLARTWAQAPCVPAGYELSGWNTAGDGTGQSIGLGEPMPDSWDSSVVNERRLFAVWRAA